MIQEHKIVSQVYDAKGDSIAANDLVKQYLPFIKKEVSRFMHYGSQADQEDALSIAMFAFHESVLSYHRGKGAFLPYAATAIKRRLIDYFRKETRHPRTLSFSEQNNENENTSLLDTLDTGTDAITTHTNSLATQEELELFAKELSSFGITLTDVATHCPKQSRTLVACHKALIYANKHPFLLEIMLKTKKLPITQLAQGARIERKTLERHRKYVFAILLAFTNGFEIIRNHLSEISSMKGGKS